MARDVEVLILTSDLDFATDRICRELERAGVSFLRLNRESLSDVELTLSPAAATLMCRYEGNEWTVGPGLRSVWWRQGTFDRNIGGAGSSLDEQLVRTQWPAFMRSLMLFSQARWYNHPAAVYRAECKGVQLREAHLLGFDVPATLMTNDPGFERAGLLGQKVALKSIDTLLLRDGADQLFGYTTITKAADVASPDLRLAPVTVQRPLIDKLDLRVTVIDDKCWPVAIRRCGQAIDGDWRLTKKHELEYEDYALEPEAEVRCVALVRALGLRYGAIDLALCDEKTWFIEINPTGEWGWLDRPERPLATSIAGALACAG